MARKNGDGISTDDDYQGDQSAETVGYGRPPEKNRFKPGVSGNPRGRPKGRKSPGKIVSDLLDELVSIQQNGRRKRISKMEALARQFLNNAFKGDKKSFEGLVALSKFVGGEQGQQASIEELSENDTKILASYVRRAVNNGEW